MYLNRCEKICVVAFFKKRQDGTAGFEVTSQLCDAYKTIEIPQIVNIDEYEKLITYGMFGTEDSMINCVEEYAKYFCAPSVVKKVWILLWIFNTTYRFIVEDIP